MLKFGPHFDFDNTMRNILSFLLIKAKSPSRGRGSLMKGFSEMTHEKIGCEQVQLDVSISGWHSRPEQQSPYILKL